MPGTPIPNLFLGRGDTAAHLMQWNVGNDDNGNPGGDAIDLLARSVRFAPGGVGGEAIFTTIWVALTYDMDSVSVRFTPILDGIAQDGTGGTVDLRQTVALTGTPGTRVTERFEFGMSLPYDDGSSSNAIRTALRGTWFQLLVDTVGGLGDGDLIIEQPEIEFEVVRESEQAQ